MAQQIEGSNGVDLGRDLHQVVERMGEAVNDFLAALTPEQKAKAICDFDDEEKRTFWHYTPIPRDGLPLMEMDRPQRQLALKLVATGLSRSGFVAASTIMGLEATLDMFEGWTRPLPGRDPLLYYVRVFHTPNDETPWGWSFEGHHISLNYTIAGGRIVAPTPTFFGANPAESTLGGASTLRPLAGIEDIARELIHGLDEGQRAQAVISSVAPPDIVLTNLAYMEDGAMLASPEDLAGWQANHHVHEDEVAALRYSAQNAQGVASSALNTAQQEMLLALVGEYIRRMPDELAELELARVETAGVDSLHFAWAGSLTPHQGHYYRIQGNGFLAEYDNTQDDANHIHSVWRDPHDDFGAGILARHYAHSH